MKRARFTEDQIIGVLKEHEAGAKTADLARKHGVSEATLYNWKAKYGGMDVSEAKRLKQLEDENAKLKKLLAEQMLDAAALRELLSKKMVGSLSSAKVSRIFGPRWAQMSERRACSIVSADRKMGVLLLMPAARHGASDAIARSSPTRGSVSDIVGCSSCCGRRASPRASTASTGFIAKKAWRCASGGLARAVGSRADPGRIQAERLLVGGFRP